MSYDGAALLRKAQLIHNADRDAINVCRHSQYSADGDNTGSADSRNEDIKASAVGQRFETGVRDSIGQLRPIV